MMKLLLDTHVLLWWLKDDPKLSDVHRSLIEDTDNLCYVSTATIWEITIKKGLGKLKISDTYLDELRKEGFIELSVTWNHADHVGSLPPIHADPFDRLLVAQADMEGLTLLSVDEVVNEYGISVL